MADERFVEEVAVPLTGGRDSPLKTKLRRLFHAPWTFQLAELRRTTGGPGVGVGPPPHPRWVRVVAHLLDRWRPKWAPAGTAWPGFGSGRGACGWPGSPVIAPRRVGEVPPRRVPWGWSEGGWF